ncbi:glycosyltransferase family 4 protein [Robertkochia marina]|uniref:Glycosyltransferase family 4 protein n=1 Tax=Robertkochia marina TaxID=1227945 RepID=A0A4S3M076_9FLAO|nr:glycosyltransferase [Robertkochia marina]THD67731.1 glycosyltransferase family 4 protein [Robertkochia marina]TRZ40946.1 glycosyltransferase family 4 protein [Robertkochia marina]
MKVAIIHYWFVTRRGGEKVVENLLKLYPDADIYTLFYDKSTYGNYLEDHNVYVSMLGKSKFLRKHYQKIFPLYPIGIKSLRLQDNYDLVISSESGPAKGIEIPEGTPHICYIHSPMRYCWGYTEEYLRGMNRFLQPVARYFFNKLRKWDSGTVDNVDLYIANSDNVKNRVNKYYNRDAKVAHPPIASELFNGPLKSNGGEHYLSFGAITPYKRIDLLVETFNRNGKKLVVVGDGAELNKLQQKAKSNITFTGALEWSEIQKIIKNSRALIFPGEEDFGMIPLEVMAFGLPVIAYGAGGALETVIENKNNTGRSSGLFFGNQTVTSLQRCIDDFENKEQNFNPEWIRTHASKFSEEHFIQKFMSLAGTYLNKETIKN